MCCLFVLSGGSVFPTGLTTSHASPTAGAAYPTAGIYPYGAAQLPQGLAMSTPNMMAAAAATGVSMPGKGEQVVLGGSKHNLDRSSTRPKFDRSGVRTHDFQIMDCALYFSETFA